MYIASRIVLVSERTAAMAKRETRKSANWVCQDYPFRTELNEEGKIVFYVPVEANSYDALVTLHAEEQGGTKYLPIGPGRAFPVVFVRTTNAAYAYDQCAWLSRITRMDRQWNRHHVSLENWLNPDMEEGPAPDCHWFMRSGEEPLSEVEYADLVSRIAEFLDRKHPKNPGYRKVFLWRRQGFSLDEIAEKLDIRPGTVYDYLDVIRTNIREYRQRYIQD